MTRLADWEARLGAFLAAREGVCFTWGATDGGMFAADAVLAMTGADPAAAFRGRYSTAMGAARALKRHGADSLEATLDTLFAPVGPAFARRGDLVLSEACVGVVIGGDAVFAGIEGGLVRVARAEWEKAWRV